MWSLTEVDKVPFKCLPVRGEKSRKTYSDHDTILLKVNLITVTEKQKKNRIITNCGYKKYRKKLTEKQISGILKKNTIQKSYDKWLEEVQSNIREIEKFSSEIQERISCNLKEKNKPRTQYQTKKMCTRRQ